MLNMTELNVDWSSIDTELAEVRRKMEDPFYASLMPSYLQLFRSRITLLQKLVEEDDIEGIEDLGHAIKGSASVYTFAFTSRMGELLEFVSDMDLQDDRNKTIHNCCENLTMLRKAIDEKIL